MDYKLKRQSDWFSKQADMVFDMRYDAPTDREMIFIRHAAWVYQHVSNLCNALQVEYDQEAIQSHLDGLREEVELVEKGIDWSGWKDY